jgi:hypothetical protein
MSYLNRQNSKNKNLIYEMDVFGEQIYFTFDGKSTMKTTAGVCGTFMLLVIGVVMFFFMGQSFFFRAAPQSIYSNEMLEKIPVISTIEKTMFIAVRLGTTLKKYPLNGQLFQGNSNLYFPNQNVVKALPFFECDNAPGLDRTYLRKIGVINNNYYCFPITDSTLGGGPDDPNYSFISTFISVCESGAPNCNKSLSANIGQGNFPIYLDIMYPQIFFNPSNLAEPFKVQHALVTDTYSKLAVVDRRFYIKQSEFTDDLGWLLADEKKTYAKSVGDTYYATYTKPTISVEMFKQTFIVTSFYEKYTRKFQKLQDLIAIVGGFLKICQFAMSMLIFYYSKYAKSEHLINGLINWQKDSDETAIKAPMNQIKTVIQELSIIPSINDNFNRPNVERPSTRKKTRNDITNTDTPDMSQLKLKDNISNIHLDKPRMEDQDNSQLDLHYNKNKHINFIKPLDSMKSNKTDKLPFATPNRFRYQLTVCEVIKRALCRRCMNKRELQRTKVFDIGDNYVRGILDVFGYMNLVIEVNNLKTALLNTAQRKCFNFYERPTFFISDEMDDNKIRGLHTIINNNRGLDATEDRKRIAEYFAHRIYSNSANHIDLTLIKQLDQEAVQVVARRLDEIKNMVKNGKVPDFEQHLFEEERE